MAVIDTQRSHCICGENNLKLYFHAFGGGAYVEHCGYRRAEPT